MSDKALFIRLMAEEDKGVALAEGLARQRAEEADPQVFQVATESFELVPGAPFAYWVSDAVRETFRRRSAFKTEGRMARQGLVTAGRFSRGVEVIANAGMTFIGNVDESIQQLVNSTEHDLFLPLPATLDLAVINRFYCYLPGWEMPKRLIV